MIKELQDRILDVVDGTQTGAILRCAMGRNGAVPVGPAFTSKAVVTSDGFVQANFLTADCVTKHSAFIGSWDDVQNNVERLAQVMRLKPSEKTELLELLRDWVAIDYSGKVK